MVLQNLGLWCRRSGSAGPLPLGGPPLRLAPGARLPDGGAPGQPLPRPVAAPGRWASRLRGRRLVGCLPGRPAGLEHPSSSCSTSRSGAPYHRSARQARHWGGSRLRVSRGRTRPVCASGEVRRAASSRRCPRGVANTPDSTNELADHGRERADRSPPRQRPGSALNVAPPRAACDLYGFQGRLVPSRREFEERHPPPEMLARDPARAPQALGIRLGPPLRGARDVAARRGRGWRRGHCRPACRVSREHDRNRRDPPPGRSGLDGARCHDQIDLEPDELPSHVDRARRTALRSSDPPRRCSGPRSSRELRNFLAGTLPGRMTAWQDFPIEGRRDRTFPVCCASAASVARRTTVKCLENRDESAIHALKLEASSGGSPWHLLDGVPAFHCAANSNSAPGYAGLRMMANAAESARSLSRSASPRSDLQSFRSADRCTLSTECRRIQG